MKIPEFSISRMHNWNYKIIDSYNTLQNLWNFWTKNTPLVTSSETNILINRSWLVNNLPCNLLTISSSWYYMYCFYCIHDRSLSLIGRSFILKTCNKSGLCYLGMSIAKMKSWCFTAMPRKELNIKKYVSVVC